MRTVNETVANYIAAWNETDPARRREIVARAWAEDGSYLDAHRDGTGCGGCLCGSGGCAAGPRPPGR